MKLYLSSYRIGDQGAKLAELATGKTALVIRNALDFSTDFQRLAEGREREISQLAAFGISGDALDLRSFFGKKEQLKVTVQQAGMLWVVGGNTFILRNAMKQSGLDKILLEMKNDSNFLYAGYSAGVCVLSPSLKGIHLGDKPHEAPVGYEHEVIWDGIGLLDDYIVPHYRCDHFESESMEAVANYYESERLPYRTIADGEVIIQTTGEPDSEKTHTSLP